MWQTLVHYFLHLVFPGIVAWLLFPKKWKRAYLFMLLTMLVDADHLLAEPIFDANRCSIGFHPLHQYWVFPAYVVLVFVRAPWRYIGIGLCLHMLTDKLDCWMMTGL